MRNSITKRNLIILDNISNMMAKLLKMNDIKDLLPKAQDLADALKSFSKVVKSNKKIPFEYRDVLEKERSTYATQHVPFLNNFNGEVSLTPFGYLIKASQIVVKSDGKQIPYPPKLKIGNETIGQAWLSDNTEVFSPRHALNKSMNDTAQRLYDWSCIFKYELQKEVTRTNLL